MRAAVPRAAHERDGREQGPVAVRANNLLRAQPVLHGHHGRTVELPLETLRERLEVIALACEDQQVGVELGRVGRRPHGCGEVRAPRDTEAASVQRARVLGAPRQQRHVGHAREMCGEQAADRSPARDTHSRHPRLQPNSRPPVRPDGLRIKTRAITAPIVTSRVPFGSVSRKPICTVFSASPRNELRALIASAPRRRRRRASRG